MPSRLTNRARGLTFLFVLGFTGFTYGQTTQPKTPGRSANTVANHRPDVLTRIDNTTTEVIVVEIDDKVISYRKSSNPTGPLYRIPRTEVKSIRYDNGEVEQFTKVSPPVAAPRQPVAPRLGARYPVARPPVKKPAIVRRVAPREALFGITGGVGLSNLRTSANDQTISTNGLLAYRIGAFSRLSIEPSNRFSVMPSLEYVLMGAKQKGGNSNAKFHYGMLTVPVAYQAFGTNDLRFVATFGPYVGYAFSGSTSDGTTSAPIEFNTGTGGIKRIQYGLTATAGVRLKTLAVFAYYTQNLGNLLNDGVGGDQAKTKIKAYGLGVRVPVGQ